MIKTADWIIDMGPEGGSGGGTVVAQGTPEDVVSVSQSHTGQFLATQIGLLSSRTLAERVMRTIGLADEPLYDGIGPAIEELERRGWLLGVATGKSDRGLKRILEHHGLHPRFVTLQTADTHPSKPHPSMLWQAMADAGAAPGTTAMIGDTSFDMAMARDAGCAAIGVAWGYHQGDALRDAGAQVVAEHPSDLVAILAALP